MQERTQMPHRLQGDHILTNPCCLLTRFWFLLQVTPNGSIAKPKKCQGGDEQGSGAAVKPSLGLAKDKDDPSQKQEYDSAVQLAKGLDMNQTRISSANAKNKFDIRGEQLVTQIQIN